LAYFPKRSSLVFSITKASVPTGVPTTTRPSNFTGTERHTLSSTGCWENRALLSKLTTRPTSAKALVTSSKMRGIWSIGDTMYVSSTYERSENPEGKRDLTTFIAEECTKLNKSGERGSP
jgi:hypothetical protein